MKILLIYLIVILTITVNGKTTYPIVADPTDTLVNRLYVDYTGLPKTSVILGRQIINLNNQRHIGAVGWRQNDQTFDAISVKNNSIANTEIFYAYSTQVNRIFRLHSAQGTWKDTQIHLLNLSYDAKTFGKISVYDYLLDLPNAAAYQHKHLVRVTKLSKHSQISNLGLTRNLPIKQIMPIILQTLI